MTRNPTPCEIHNAFVEIVCKHDRDNPDDPSHVFTFRWLREAENAAREKINERETA